MAAGGDALAHLLELIGRERREHLGPLLSDLVRLRELERLANEILATLQVNVDRELLGFSSEEARQRFEVVLSEWRDRLRTA